MIKGRRVLTDQSLKIIYTIRCKGSELLGRQAERMKISPGEIVRAIAAGDKSAEQELVYRYWKSLYFILSKRCGNPQLAADLTQDAFLVVLLKARNSEINSPEALSAFVRQTGVNLMIAHFRKEQRRATDVHGEVEFEIPDHKSNVTKAVESNQTLEIVQQLIDEMRIDRDRDILMSFYAKEEDKGSICKRLELTPAHFDRVLFRAKNRLKQLIDYKLGGQSGFS